MINDVCCICLEEGNRINKLYHLPCECNYYIHRKCTLKLRNDICIICKKPYIEIKDINLINKKSTHVVYLDKNNFKNKYFCDNFIVFVFLFF